MNGPVGDRRLAFVVTLVTFFSGSTLTAQTGPAPVINRQPASRGAPPAQTTFRSDQPRVVVQPKTNPTGAGATPMVMPPGFPLRPDARQRVDQILRYWEDRTTDIKTYQVKFVRRNYDFVFGKRDKPKTIDVGVIRFRAPDKGLMRVDRVFDVVPNVTDPQKQYVEKQVEFGEYWVCDGASVFQFDARAKTLTETQLPPEMRGKAIAEGPLPFMFGAKADTMKERYWIREASKEEGAQDGAYYLWAIPKRQQDAANFDRLLVKLVVSGEQLLPSAMKVFVKNGRVDYEFEAHATNDTRHRVAGFLNSFVSPKKPRGWTKVVENWDGVRVDEHQATRPETQQPR